MGWNSDIVFFKRFPIKGFLKFSFISTKWVKFFTLQINSFENNDSCTKVFIFKNILAKLLFLVNQSKKQKLKVICWESSAWCTIYKNFKLTSVIVCLLQSNKITWEITTKPADCHQGFFPWLLVNKVENLYPLKDMQNYLYVFWWKKVSRTTC